LFLLKAALSILEPRMIWREPSKSILIERLKDD
jgi:hypothetical protein